MGKVYLIGAGPGAADLITVRGMRLLQQADLVLYDALVQEDMLSWCPQAIKIEVGKRCGKLSTAQHFINKQIIDAAHHYRLVVRLKGGDPMLFGRADEELSALELAGVAYEVVPGVTAALAAAASINLPLTKRGVTRHVSFLTQSTADNVDSGAGLPESRTETLVYYMGRRQAQCLAQDLVDSGFDVQTSVWVVEAVSTVHERVLSTTLEKMAQGLVSTWLNHEQPCLLMIGQALACRSTMPAVLSGLASNSAAQ